MTPKSHGVIKGRASSKFLPNQLCEQILDTFPSNYAAFVIFWIANV